MMRKLLVAVALAALLAAPGRALATDCSGTIATGGTAQAVSAVNGNTRGLFLMNNSPEVMCVAWSGSAATIAGTNCGAGSYALSAGSATVAGGSFFLPPNIRINSLSIIAATTGSRFSCERQ
jgi:hypothetical protein